MSENGPPSSRPISPPQSVRADRLLFEFAETLDVSTVQQHHPEWSRERIRSLFRAAAFHLSPDERPAVYQRLGALLPIFATYLAGRLLLLFGWHMKGALDSLGELGVPVSLMTRLALSAADWRTDPVKILCGAMLAVCLGWAWRSRKRLRWFTTWASIVGTILGLAYLLICLYPLFSLWLQADRGH
jgi:hypothetical protein